VRRTIPKESTHEASSDRYKSLHEKRAQAFDHLSRSRVRLKPNPYLAIMQYEDFIFKFCQDFLQEAASLSNRDLGACFLDSLPLESLELESQDLWECLVRVAIAMEPTHRPPTITDTALDLLPKLKHLLCRMAAHGSKATPRPLEVGGSSRAGRLPTPTVSLFLRPRLTEAHSPILSLSLSLI